MTANLLNHLIKFFKGGNAEAEKDIRGEIFVKPEIFDKLLNFDYHSSVILLGNKGVGKTIFVTVMHEAFLKNNELSLLLTPDDMQCDAILSKKTLADKKSVAYGQILNAMAGIIGKHSASHEIGISSDVVALQQMALKDGLVKADWISKFASILSKATPYGKDIAQALLNEQGRNLSTNNLTGVIDNYLEDRNKNMWLFLDDIDAAVAGSSLSTFDYAACWAIISAAIELCEDINGLKCVVSVRSDIWHLMTNVHKHGIERKDKLGNIQELKFSELELENIFKKRITLATQSANSSIGLKTFFQDDVITLPGAVGEKRNWEKWVAKVSRSKPRDLVKLVQVLINQAKIEKSDLIGSKQAHAVIGKFAEERVENIIDEYSGICPQISEVIKDLTKQNNYSFLEIMAILKSAAAKRAILIDGIAAKQDNDSAIKLLRLLHMACFINPRVDSNDVYTHLNYAEYPNLVDLAKLNDLQKYSWQVHPTFHSYSENEKRKNKFA